MTDNPLRGTDPTATDLAAIRNAKKEDVSGTRHPSRFEPRSKAFQGNIAGSILKLNPQLSLPTNPIEGMFAYTSTGHQYQFWNGSAWVGISASSVGVASVNGTAGQINVAPITGNVFVSLPSTITLGITWSALQTFSGGISVAGSILDTTGPVVIGVDPGAPNAEILRVGGAAIFAGAAGAANGRLNLGNAGGQAPFQFVYDSTTPRFYMGFSGTTGADMQFYSSGTGVGSKMILKASGELDVITGPIVVGTDPGGAGLLRGISVAANPAIYFQMLNAFSGTSVGSSIVGNGNLTLVTTDAQAADIGALLSLGGSRGSNGFGVFGGVRGAKLNSTDASTAGYLGFYTLQGGVAFQERWRIIDTGTLRHTSLAGEWSKIEVADSGVTTLGRLGSDVNGLTMSTNALFSGTWNRDDTTKTAFAIIQHLGNGQMEFRVAAGAANPITWTTALVIGAINVGRVDVPTGPLVVGTDPNTGEMLRVGGAVRASGNIATGVNTGAGTSILINAAVGNVRDVNWQTAGVARWVMRANATAEGGASAGSDFQLIARDDTGAIIDNAILITRAAGGNFSTNRPFITGTDPGGSEQLRAGGNVNFNNLIKSFTAGAGVYLKIVGDSGTADRGGLLLNNTTAAVRHLKATATFTGSPGSSSRFRLGWVADSDLETFLNGGAAIEIGPTHDLKINASGTGFVIIGADPGTTALVRIGGTLIVNGGGNLAFGNLANILRFQRFSATTVSLLTDGNAYGALNAVAVGPGDTSTFFLQRNGSNLIQMTAADFSPVVNGALTLGTATLAWNAIYLNVAAGIFWYNGATNNGYLQIDGGANFNISLNGTLRAVMTTAAFSPIAAAGLTLGTTALPWAQTYISTSGAIANARGILCIRSNSTTQNGFYLEDSLGSPLDAWAFGISSGGAFNGLGWYDYTAGRLVFSMLGTGTIAISTSPVSQVGIFLNSTLTGSTAGYGIHNVVTFQSDVTSIARAFSSQPSTQAAVFTLSQIAGFYAWDVIKGAGSIITNQYGLYVESQTKGNTNYAIFTNAGLVRFGDKVQVISANSQLQLLSTATGVDVSMDFGRNSVVEATFAIASTGGNWCTDAVAGDLVIRNTSTNVIKLLGGSGHSVLAITDTAVIVGTDPAGSRIFRVGGSAKFNGSVELSLAGANIDFSGGDLTLQRGGITKFTATTTLTNSVQDFSIDVLGTFDHTGTRFGTGTGPVADDVMSWHGGASKWRPRFLQTQFTNGVVTAQNNTDGTFSNFAFAVTYSNATPAVPAVPIVTPIYGGFIIDMGALPPAGSSYVLDYSINGGAYTTNRMIFTSQKIVHTVLSNNGTQVFTSTDTFAYKAKGRGKADGTFDSAYSAATGTKTYVTTTEVNAFGLVLASQVTAVYLSAITANVGSITAGQLIAGDGKSILQLDSTFSVPGTVTQGIFFASANPVGAGITGMYIDFTATGTNPLFHHATLDLKADGSAVFKGPNAVARDANSKFVADFGAALLTVTDNQGAPKVRAKLGKIGAGTTDYGLQVFDNAGSTIVDMQQSNLLIQDANVKFKADFTNALLTVTDNQGAPKTRVKVGKIAGGTTDYGIQVFDNAGSTIVDMSTSNLLIQDALVKFKADFTNALVTITDNQGSPVIRAKFGKVSSGTTDYGLQLWDQVGATIFDFTGAKRILAVPIQDIGSKSAAFSVDFSTGLTQRVMLAASALAMTFTSPTNGQRARVWFQQDITGSRTLPVHGDTVMWAADTAPTLSTEPGVFDVVEYEYSIVPSPRYLGIVLAANVKLPTPQVQSITSSQLASSTNHNVVMPATAVTGDLLIAIMGVNGATPIVNNTPTGWTHLSDSETGVVGLWIFVKISDGTEGGTTVNFTTSVATTMAAQVYRITRWYGSLTYVLAGIVTGNSTNPDPPSATATWTDRTLWIACATSAGGIASAAPTNYTNLTTNTSVSANMSTARRPWYATTEDPSAFSAATGAWVAVTLSIRPPP